MGKKTVKYTKIKCECGLTHIVPVKKGSEKVTES